MRSMQQGKGAPTSSELTDDLSTESIPCVLAVVQFHYSRYKVAERPLIETSSCARKSSARRSKIVMTSAIVGLASGSVRTHLMTSSRKTLFVTSPICS